MTLIDDIKKDMAKGTPGPWDESLGYVHRNRALLPAAPDQTRLEGESWLDMRRRIQPQLDARNAECEANTRRIARVPEMEVALLAAEELARSATSALNALEHMEGKGNSRASVDLRAALSAYREATK